MSSKKEKPLPTSSLGRMVKMGSLMGRVGGSMIGNRAASILRSGPAQEAKRLENLIRNATRVVETLSEMRGAAMKVGQMLSLQEGFLPPEVNRILQTLQGSAPQVPPEVMRYEVEGALGGSIEELFLEFDTEAHAAASIGQVHRARLHDGRRVAVKVQYPLIREVVTADLANLKTLMKSLFSMVMDADFEPLWLEVRDRLLEELDYEHEARTQQRFRELHRDVPEIVIPEVVSELSSDRVLTMIFEEGLDPAEACSHSSEALRDRWGAALLEFQLRGLLEHRLLHADPNLANFAFRTDGKLIVYDFGSVKEVPRELSQAYARVLMTCLEGRWETVPDALVGLGLTRADGSPLDAKVIGPHLELLSDILREDPPYRFGEDEDVLHRVLEAGMENWSQATDLSFPSDVIFIQRSLSGHFGNLTHLRATGLPRAVVECYARATLDE